MIPLVLMTQNCTSDAQSPNEGPLGALDLLVVRYLKIKQTRLKKLGERSVLFLVFICWHPIPP